MSLNRRRSTQLPPPSAVASTSNGPSPSPPPPLSPLVVSGEALDACLTCPICQRHRHPDCLHTFCRECRRDPHIRERSSPIKRKKSKLTHLNDKENTAPHDEPVMMTYARKQINSDVDCSTSRPPQSDELHVEVDTIEDAHVPHFLLRMQETHRLQALIDKEEMSILTVRHPNSLLEYDERYEPYLKASGFFGIHQIQGVNIDDSFIRALFERWRPETNTFHLPVGEMTITLEDVAILLGLPVDGLPVCGTTKLPWDMYIEKYLGITPDANAMANKSSLKLSWLRTKFGSLRPEATNLEIQQHFRAFLLCLIGSFLMVDLTGDSVPCMYLSFLADLDNIRLWSWGSAVLAKMYRMLCHACKKNAKQIAGPIPLMQMWAYERFKLGRPVALSRVPEDLPPRGFYWSKRHEWKKRNKCALEDYRKMLDLMQDEDVEWTPYDISIRSLLPPTCMAGHEIWLSTAPLIDFNTVETYHPDRTMRQFNKFQVIPPRSPRTLPDAHKVDRRMYPYEDWLVYHSAHVAAWNDRKKLIIDEARHYDHQSHTAYMAWYNVASIPTFSPYIGLSADGALVREQLGCPRLRTVQFESPEHLRSVSFPHGDTLRTEEGEEFQNTSKSVSSISSGMCNEGYKWHARVKEVYEKGDMKSAEEYFTHRINSLSSGETYQSSNQSLVLCYSNRAAVRMSLGQIRKALSDCSVAYKIDPTFSKVQLQNANCLVALGDLGEAIKQFKKCFESSTHENLDPVILSQASSGLDKAHKVLENISLAEDLMKLDSDGVSRALNLISDALSVCSHSNRLMEMKANALLKLRRYGDAIRYCELSPDSDGNDYISEQWRLNIIVKSYFHLGKLDEALDVIKKNEQAAVNLEWYEFDSSSSETEKEFELNGNKAPVPDTAFLVNLRELARLKTAGNEAFHAGRYTEAVEHYSAAIALSTESRFFTAVFLCNRAAAYQAIRQIVDAITDCSLAIALVPTYTKAFSRRTVLYDMIRDYNQEANDLRILISLLEKQQLENQTGKSSKTNTSDYLNRVHRRLLSAEDSAKKSIPLNFYLILGVDDTASEDDVKNAYEKAALKHRPDMVIQSLPKNETLDGDAIWIEDADHLFQIIGEAYAVLSDTTKRAKYDSDEKKRHTKKTHS